MNSGTYLKKMKGSRLLAELQHDVDIINAKKESLYLSLLDHYLLMKRCNYECNNLEHSGPSYDATCNIIDANYYYKIWHIHRIFNEFVIVNPFTIEYGSKTNNSFMVCKYGELDGFRLAIQNHISYLEEIKGDFRIFIPFSKRKKDIQDTRHLNRDGTEEKPHDIIEDEDDYDDYYAESEEFELDQELLSPLVKAINDYISILCDYLSKVKKAT